MTDRLTEARRALAEAPAYSLVERLGEALAKRYDINDTELLQADYRLAALIPLRGGEPVTKPGSAAWRAFDHQTPVIEKAVGMLPVTVRGDRIGVLRLAPLPPAPAALADLTEIATALAHELAGARLTTDRYAVAARSRRLTLAAEMQWELLPGRSRSSRTYRLAGQLEPAYAVRGDTFDWADDADRLYLSVINGMGEGVNAAMLTTLATNAVRNARRAGLALEDQASLADQAVYSYHLGTQHVSALLLELDLATGHLTAVDAGSPRLLVMRAGEVAEQRLDAQFPLGMFDGTIYRPQRFQLAPGDRALVVSDGVFDAAADTRLYGESALDRFIRRTGGLAPLNAVRALLGDLRAFVGGDLDDDAVAVCLDWIGPEKAT